MMRVKSSSCLNITTLRQSLCSENLRRLKLVKSSPTVRTIVVLLAGTPIILLLSLISFKGLQNLLRHQIVLVPGPAR